MKKRGQVTIFIIMGIIIISIIISFFLFRGAIVSDMGEKPEKNPNAFLESCIEDTIRESIEIISMQGGYVENPLYIAFKFSDEEFPSKLSYLCYTPDSYSLCIPQEPLLISHLEDEIYNYIHNDMDSCFDELVSSLEKRRYNVDAIYRGFDVNLAEKRVEISIDAELTLTKSGETTKQESFKIITPSKIYELAMMVQEIINNEATRGEFNHYDMFQYPEFDINKYVTSDSSVVYRIKYVDSEEEFRFAVRGSVMPSGFGIEFE